MLFTIYLRVESYREPRRDGSRGTLRPPTVKAPYQGRNGAGRRALTIGVLGQ